MKYGQSFLSRFAEYMLLSLFCIFLLSFYYYDFLFIFQELSFFSSSDFFHNEQLHRSAGPLVFISSYLTQLLYYPAIGVALITCTLLLNTFIIRQLLKIEHFAFLPSLLWLLAFSRIGYSLYDTFPKDFIFSSLIGLTYTSLFTLFFSRKSRYTLPLSIIITLIFLPLVGIYASLALLVAHATGWLRDKDKNHLIGCGTALLLMFLFPLLGGKYFYHESYKVALFAPLPANLYTVVLVLTLGAILSLPLAHTLSNLIQTKGLNKTWTNLACCATACLLLFSGAYKDVHFRKELKVQRLSGNHKWSEIIQETNSLPTLTTNLFAYRAIALTNKRQSDRIFHAPCRIEESEDAIRYRRPIINEDLFFYSSFINDSYLYTMEFWVQIGYSYQRLKRMTMCALLNGEYNLARKYISVLQHTMFQKKWANEMAQYLDNPDAFYQSYPELTVVRQNIPTERMRVNVIDLSDNYTYYKQLSFVNAERRLMADLYRKDLRAFAADIMPMRRYYASKPMPTCIKEGILLCAMNGMLDPIKNIPVERTLSDNAKNFIATIQRHGSAEEAYQVVQKRYSKSYLLYYYFSHKNLK